MLLSKCYDVKPYLVQDACNLSGVLLSFADAVIRLRELGVSTYDRQGINEPTIVAFLDKIHDLCGRPDHNQTMSAFDACHLADSMVRTV